MPIGIEPETIRAAIDRMADCRGTSVFLYGPETRQEITFADLQRQSNELARRLLSLGLSKGDKVAFLLDNGLFSAGLLVGAMYGGLVPVPLNTRAGKAHLAYALNHCDARVVFVSAAYADTVDEILGEGTRQWQIIRADEHGGPAWHGAIPSLDSLPDIHADDDALLIYTSGSTGNPKGVELRHRNVVAAATNSRISHEITANDCSLCVLPLYHINAPMVTLISSLLAGAAVVMPRKFLVREFWQWMSDYRCTWSALVPTIISQLMDWNDPWAEGMENGLRQIRFMRSSSAPLAPALHRAFEKRFPILLIEAMGSTEAGGNVFSNPLPPEKNKIGSPGLPWGFEAKVVDPHGADVLTVEPGEIFLRGPSVMKGYYKNPDETAAVLSADGWFRTGDLAHIDEDGYFFVVGRAKELIIKGGMNIAPRQIDEALESHPAVLEAAAVGVSDHYFGEDIVAFVVLRDDVHAGVPELLEVCERHLGKFKTPSKIHIVDELPKGPSGKMQRLRVAEKYKDLMHSVDSASRSLDAKNGRQRLPIGFEAPGAVVEELVALTWGDVLKCTAVGPRDNFFGLGGHSLAAIETLFRVQKQFSVGLSLNEFFSNPTVAQQAALISERLFNDGLPATGISSSAGVHRHGEETSLNGRQPIPQSRAALDELLRQRRTISREEPIIPRRDRSSPCPLSYAQERLLFLAQLYPGMRAYNEGDAVRLRGPLDARLLEDALNVVVARHESLRTVIREQNGGLVQIVCDEFRLRIAINDLSDATSKTPEEELHRLVNQEMSKAHDLAGALPIRATLLRIALDDHIFILSLHHIICDGWSMGVFYRELEEAYRALRRGLPIRLPSAQSEYCDYAAWQRRRVENGELAKDLYFWMDYLSGAPNSLELPTAGPRPAIFSHVGDKRTFQLGRAALEGLRAASVREQVSQFVLLTSLLNVLLYRYTGQEDIVLGIPIANRDRAELLSLIGFMIDFQALRTDLSGNPTVEDLVKRVQRGVLEVNEHRSVPFDKVVNTLQPTRDLSRSPLFQVMLIWKDRNVQMQFMELDGLSAIYLPAHPKSSKVDLTFWMTDVGDDLWVEVEYCTDLFAAEMIERMVGHFRVLLQGIVRNPRQRLGEIPLLTAAERQQLLVDWNNTAVQHPYEKCVHQLFEDQAARTPNRVAVAFEGQELTYRELNERANQLANHLRSLGVEPETLVGLCLDRSLELVIGILGILKAGGAYVPLDANHPPQRLEFILRDSAVTHLVTHRQLLRRLPDTIGGTVFLGPDEPGFGDFATENPQSGVCPHHLAYTMYTSGSTGHPKGVLIPHSAVVNLLSTMAVRPGLAPSDRLLSVTTPTFDISVLEILLPLAVGACVEVLTSDVVSDAASLAVRLAKSAATVMQATPATWQMLVQTGWEGNPNLKALCGGEALPGSLAAELRRRSGELWNMYGPTETTIWSTTQQVTGERICCSIGRPIANTLVYVLDKHDQPAPIGVPGELCIGGSGLARGYLNRPELTDEKFVPNPFDNARQTRMYRTGDLCRWRRGWQPGIPRTDRPPGQAPRISHRVGGNRSRAATASVGDAMLRRVA